MSIKPIKPYAIATAVEGQLKISWENSTDADFSHTKIYISTTKGALGSVVADNLTGNSYFYIGLPETIYYITVVAVDVNGVESSNNPQLVSATWKLVTGVNFWSITHGERILSMGANSTTGWSSDYGDTFTTIPNNLPAGEVLSWVGTNGTIIAFVMGLIKMFKSTDDGATFSEAVFKDEAGNIINGLSHPQTRVSHWGFTEDDRGHYYLTEYANVQSSPGVHVNLMYWYKSTDDGVTWHRKDNLRHTDDKHFHQIKFNPYSKELIITTGDAYKLTFKSINYGDTWTEVKPTTYPDMDALNGKNYGGFTGIGFFPSGEILWGTDWKPRLNGVNTNWFTRSIGTDVNTFTYDLMPTKWDGFSGEILTDVTTGEAWQVHRDEYNRDWTASNVQYSPDKGLTWKPILATESEDNVRQASVLPCGDIYNRNTTPYIFVGMFRITETTTAVVRMPKIPFEIDEFSISPYNALMVVGKEMKLSAKDQNGNDISGQVSWSIGNDLATISPTGLVTPNSVGSVLVRCEYNGRTLKSWLPVMSENPSHIGVVKLWLDADESITLPLYNPQNEPFDNTNFRLPTENGIRAFKLTDNQIAGLYLKINTEQGLKYIKGYE